MRVGNLSLMEVVEEICRQAKVDYGFAALLRLTRRAIFAKPIQGRSRAEAHGVSHMAEKTLTKGGLSGGGKWRPTDLIRLIH
jgi:hypothetical protein